MELPDYAKLLAIVVAWSAFAKTWPILKKIFGEITGWKSVVLVFVITLIAGFFPELKTAFAMLPALIQKLAMLLLYAGSFAGLYKITMNVADKVGGNGK